MRSLALAILVISFYSTTPFTFFNPSQLAPSFVRPSTATTTSPSTYSILPASSTQLSAIPLPLATSQISHGTASAYSYTESPSHIHVKLSKAFPLSLKSKHVELVKVLPGSVRDLHNTTTGNAIVDFVVASTIAREFERGTAVTPSLRRNVLLLLNKNGGIHLSAPNITVAGILPKGIVWDSMFYTIEAEEDAVGDASSKSVSLEWEKVNLIEQWQKRNYETTQNGKSAVEDKMRNMVSNIDPAVKDEAEKLLSTGSSDLLYEGDNYWNMAFFADTYSPHKTSFDFDEKEEDANVDKYIDHMTHGQGIDESKVNKNMYTDVVFGNKTVMEEIEKSGYGKFEQRDIDDNFGFDTDDDYDDEGSYAPTVIDTRSKEDDDVESTEDGWLQTMKPKPGDKPL
jgi:hypothetical protein